MDLEYRHGYIGDKRAEMILADFSLMKSQIVELNQLLINNMKQPNLQLAQQLLADWWLNNDTVTSLEFKEELRSEYKDHNWTQQWVSYFLGLSGHQFDDNGQFKIYHRDAPLFTISIPNMLANISVPVTQIKLNEAWKYYQYSPNPSITNKVTKKQIKQILANHLNVNDFSNFDEEFEKSGFCWSGTNNSERHKEYVWLKDDEYWSQSKQEILKLANMPKAHIKNSLLKRYSGVNIDEILNYPNKEVNKLLKAYFA